MWVYEKKSLYLDVTWERVWTELLLGFATAKKKDCEKKENAKLLKNNKKIGIPIFKTILDAILRLCGLSSCYKVKGNSNL